ncbi:hypothetical protein Bpfe_019561 [Biomphalaria pfeifferi]|uniref:Uncharacterized protein n=1 Tax=Biomphalaria pfeifferi TaxID=112525 RepID=A0AAD8BAS6_BIOPF|nr:hypothetical protein Bpfe_019561 [Biomphalaria pfeifferi]
MVPACASQPRSEPALSVGGLVWTLVMPVTQLNVQPAGNTKDRGSPFILKWREASKPMLSTSALGCFPFYPVVACTPYKLFSTKYNNKGHLVYTQSHNILLLT